MATVGLPAEARPPAWLVWASVAASAAFDWLVARTMLPFAHGPDAVTAVALALAAAGSRRPAAAVALAGGLLADLPGGVLLGLGSVTRLVAVSLGVQAWSRLQTDSYAALAGVALAAALVEGLLGLAGAWFFGLPVAFSSARALALLEVALLTTGLFALAYPVAAWLCWPRPVTRAGEPGP